jgi:hypothetical protein
VERPASAFEGALAGLVPAILAFSTSNDHIRVARKESFVPVGFGADGGDVGLVLLGRCVVAAG